MHTRCLAARTLRQKTTLWPLLAHCLCCPNPSRAFVCRRARAAFVEYVLFRVCVLVRPWFVTLYVHVQRSPGQYFQVHSGFTHCGGQQASSDIATPTLPLPSCPRPSSKTRQRRNLRTVTKGSGKPPICDKVPISIQSKNLACGTLFNLQKSCPWAI